MDRLLRKMFQAPNLTVLWFLRRYDGVVCFDPWALYIARHTF